MSIFYLLYKTWYAILETMDLKFTDACKQKRTTMPLYTIIINLPTTVSKE